MGTVVWGGQGHYVSICKKKSFAVAFPFALAVGGAPASDA